MAIRFGLFVECDDERAAQACVEHFQNLEIKLLSGQTTRWSAGLSDFIVRAVEVISFELSAYGIRSVRDAIDATEAGLHLLRHLKSAPAFVFARVGIEVGNISSDELQDIVEVVPHDSQRKRLSLDCVLHEKLFATLGNPEGFTPFYPGYVWNKYYGESYRPLYSGDQPDLNAKCRELFPEYFKY